MNKSRKPINLWPVDANQFLIESLKEQLKSHSDKPTIEWSCKGFLGYKK